MPTQNTDILRPRHRLFIDAELVAGVTLDLDRAQANYLVQVLRLKANASILIFNGKAGEWLATLRPNTRKSASLEVIHSTRPQPVSVPLHYYFAPLKLARLDYMVQKAVEMGVSHLHPVQTAYTQVSRINPARLRANAIEAAEQCGVLQLPEIAGEQPLLKALAARSPNQWLVFCDEEATEANPMAALTALPKADEIGVLIGPEGGFSPVERANIISLPRVIAISLGPRILRADTAAVAALALIQAR